MGVETVTESIFNLWRTSRKSSASEPERKPVIGILAFEIASLMSKVVNLWQCLSDRRIEKLREEISTSLGIQKLVAEDDEHLMNLAFAEIIDNLGGLIKSLAIHGKRCADPAYHNLERIFENPVEIELNGCAWRYRLKKMDRKAKKMERFVAATTQLYQELEVLAELEQTLRRMQSGASGQMKLLEFKQKVMWQREEVRNLREMSPWVRTYDYTVRLLLRSVFTIIMRIKYLFGTNNNGVSGTSNHCELINNGGNLDRSRSISALSSVHPSETNTSESYLGSLGRSFSSLGLTGSKDRSGSRKSLVRQSSVLCGKPSQLRSRRFASVGHFKGCINSGTDSPVLESYMPCNNDLSKSDDSFQKEDHKLEDTNPVPPASCDGVLFNKAYIFNFKRKLLVAPQDTLGQAALALKYANIIILIEKLALAPHLIGLDARDDLYNMLPASVRNTLRARLKVFAKSLTSSVYDAALAADWSLALGRILDWLSPLAHNTIRWHSERNFEKQRLVYGGNVLLVQTLYFANQARTEAAVVELLMGLNYLSRFAREISAKPLMESFCARVSSEYFLHKDSNTQSSYHFYHD